MDDRTLQAFSRAVSALHEAAAAPERWPQALEAVMRLLGTQRGALMDVRADARVLERLTANGHDASVQRAYAEHYYAIDPTQDAVLALPPLDIFVCFEHFDAAVRARHEYFDFARRSDIGDVMGFATHEIEGRRHILSLQRGWSAEGFDDEAKALMALVAPHLQQAKAVEARLRAANATSLQLEAGLDRVAAAGFIVDGAGKVVHLNRTASALLERRAELGVRHGALVFDEPRLDAQFRQALRTAAGHLGRSAALPIMFSGNGRGEVLVAPLRPRVEAAWREPLALVVITEPATDADAIAWRLRQLYELTAAEARVAAQIALGRTVEDIAGAYGVKAVTLRTQLRAVFQKTGTRRQPDLVRLALAGAAWGAEDRDPADRQ